MDDLKSFAEKLSSARQRFDMSETLKTMAHAELERKAHDQGFASVLYERLMVQVTEFEKTLDPNHEVGAYLASFGTQVTIQIHHIGYHNPYFVIFSGTKLDDGSDVRLVQHVSQINVLLVALKKADPEKPARRIGFTDRDESAT
jgi:hypothetical protein